MALRSLAPKQHHTLLTVLLLLCSCCAVAAEGYYVIDDFTGLDVTVKAPSAVKTEVVDSNLVVSVDCTEARPRIVRIPLNREVKDQKMRMIISKVDDLPYMGKFETGESDLLVRNSQEHNYLEYQKGPVFFSLDNKYHKNLSFYFHCRNADPDVTGVVHIDKIEIVPLEFNDDRDFAYILAVILLLVFLLPGFLAYAVFLGSGEKGRLLALLTPLSLFFFLVLYLVLLLYQQLSSEPISWVLLTAYIVLNLVFIGWLLNRQKLHVLASNFGLIKFELLAVFLVILGVAAIVTENLELPLHTFTYNHLKYLTYGTFYAHDPIFQYVNGIAILHDEPFSKYYENRKLIYAVQDRGIIGGVIYAVMRGIASPLNRDVAYSFGFYTLFGAGLNTLVFLPIFALHKYFFVGKQRPLLILFLVSASAFFVTNYYITWYKIAGAGLVISGVVLLLLDKNSIKQWAMAGVVWGLATNFHPGLVLTFPLATIWLLFRFWRAHQNRIAPMFFALFVLAGSFVVMNLPWTMVKAAHYPDTSRLFRQHFLAFQPHDPEQGIIGSLRDFTDEYTLEQQVFKRYGRLEGSLRVDEIQSLLKPDSGTEWEDMLITWNALEASYIIFVFAPLVILLAFSSLLTRLIPATSWNRPLTIHNADFRWLLITQVLTILLIIIGSFGPFSPDITWHIPMSCSVIVIYLLAHANVAVGKIGAALIVAYALFTYYRLFFQYF
ncbi:MAG: hypothetical protein QNI91_16160 [Arenicellales bacterium]|nr:hypothetical protein [Arenicellales bacterium]